VIKFNCRRRSLWIAESDHFGPQYADIKHIVKEWFGVSPFISPYELSFDAQFIAVSGALPKAPD